MVALKFLPFYIIIFNSGENTSRRGVEPVGGMGEKHMRDYDVIVVGAGPAGGSAAYFLGQAGWRVLVLEKEHLPRYKTCGGGLSIRFLEEQFPFSFAPVLGTEITAMAYAFRRRMVTIPVRPQLIGMVMRDQLDAHILKHARAEIRQGVTVKSVIENAEGVAVETASGERFHARYLIGADGANSFVARSLGLRRKRSLVAALEAEVPVSPQLMGQFGHMPVFIFGEIRKGYLWIFPKADHLSVGAAAMRPRKGELQKKLNEVMRRYGINLDGVQLHGHPIPLYTRREPISTPRTLLVGDAAGLVDPFSGEGIRFAIKSGRLAAEALQRGQPAVYEREVFKQIGLNHILARIEAQVFFNLENLCLLLGSPNPFTTQAIVDLLSDQVSTLDVMLYAIASLPLFVGTEIAAGVASLLRGPAAGNRIRERIYPEAIDVRTLSMQ